MAEKLLAFHYAMICCLGTRTVTRRDFNDFKYIF